MCVGSSGVSVGVDSVMRNGLRRMSRLLVMNVQLTFPIVFSSNYTFTGLRGSYCPVFRCYFIMLVFRIEVNGMHDFR